MRKYRITLNDKVYEVEIEEVKKSTEEEEETITQNGSVTKSVELLESECYDTIPKE